MVNPIYTEPDPESDLDPDIRSYSQHQHHQQSSINHHNLNQSGQASQHVYPPLESNPLSFISEKAPASIDVAAANANAGHAGFNEKDYATGLAPGSGVETANSTLNPSPNDQYNLNNNIDRVSSHHGSAHSHHPADDDDDQEVTVPQITWKQCAIVCLPLLPFTNQSMLLLTRYRTRSRDVRSSAPRQSCSRSPGRWQTPASRTSPSLSPAC